MAILTVVAQFYDTDVNKEYAIRGNSVILKCQVPSFVADFVAVVSWHTDQGEEFLPGAPDGNSVHTLRMRFLPLQSCSNSTKRKWITSTSSVETRPCWSARFRRSSLILSASYRGPIRTATITSRIIVPSTVISTDECWTEWCCFPSSGHKNLTQMRWCIAAQFSKRFSVVNQYYEAEVVSEYVIRGNTAVLKCNIPSFVADFVRVEAWVGNDNRVFTYSDEYGILNWENHIPVGEN